MLSFFIFLYFSAVKLWCNIPDPNLVNEACNSSCWLGQTRTEGTGVAGQWEPGLDIVASQSFEWRSGTVIHTNTVARLPGVKWEMNPLTRLLKQFGSVCHGRHERNVPGFNLPSLKMWLASCLHMRFASYTQSLATTVHSLVQCILYLNILNCPSLPSNGVQYL